MSRPRYDTRSTEADVELRKVGAIHKGLDATRETVNYEKAPLTRRVTASTTYEVTPNYRTNSMKSVDTCCQK